MDNQQNEQDNQQNSWENARENWDKWQEEQEKKNWDHWDSNASHSSYYNQPTHPPYNQGFTIASLVFGILSATLGCCFYLSIPLGALAILFAVLCRRKSKPWNDNCRAGFVLGIAGCVFGFITMFYILSQNPLQSRQNQFNQTEQNFFTPDLQEILQNSSGLNQ